MDLRKNERLCRLCPKKRWLGNPFFFSFSAIFVGILLGTSVQPLGGWCLLKSWILISSHELFKWGFRSVDRILPYCFVCLFFFFRKCRAQLFPTNSDPNQKKRCRLAPTGLPRTCWFPPQKKHLLEEKLPGCNKKQTHFSRLFCARWMVVWVISVKLQPVTWSTRSSLVNVKSILPLGWTGHARVSEFRFSNHGGWGRTFCASKMMTNDTQQFGWISDRMDPTLNG